MRSWAADYFRLPRMCCFKIADILDVRSDHVWEHTPKQHVAASRTVLPRPPSGHRSGRRQARHARILQIGLHLTQTWTPLRHGLDPRISKRNNPMGEILRVVGAHELSR